MACESHSRAVEGDMGPEEGRFEGVGGAGAQGALVVTNMKMRVTSMKGGGVGGEDASEITTGLCVAERLHIYNI